MTLYLESASAEDDYQLDEVVLERWQEDQSWRLEAEANIEALRKRELRINFRGVDARSLTVEVLYEDEDHHPPLLGSSLSLKVEQLSHRFPFGQAVQSSLIAACHEAGTDDEYCSHISNNYNWIVDTYRRANFQRSSTYCPISRMKWKPLEPTQGQFLTAIPDAMIAWAQGHNIRYRAAAAATITTTP